MEETLQWLVEQQKEMQKALQDFQQAHPLERQSLLTWQLSNKRAFTRKQLHKQQQQLHQRMIAQSIPICVCCDARVSRGSCCEIHYHVRLLKAHSHGNTLQKEVTPETLLQRQDSRKPSQGKLNCCRKSQNDPLLELTSCIRETPQTILELLK
ncbi:unnamed protein product [Eretmochelys imbricata]